MHEQATTLKHYLKVVPTRHVTRGGRVSADSYVYSANYNEFHPPDRKPKSRSGDEMEKLVPNAVFSYNISPLRVVHRESGESWGAFLTQLCAVVGGVFTVFGLIDGVLFTAVKTVKAD